MTDVAGHWDEVYATKTSTSVSWYQSQPVTSLRLLTEASPARGSVVDVGAGASHLAESLLADHWQDVTVLDVSSQALDLVRSRLAGASLGLSLVEADVLGWQPGRTYDVWHDRAVFHFLTTPDQQRSYVRTAASAVVPGGAVVLGVFAADGPTHCSGLPTARYTAEGIAAVFAPAFALEHSEREEHVTPSGAVQPFTWAVLRRGGG